MFNLFWPMYIKAFEDKAACVVVLGTCTFEMLLSSKYDAELLCRELYAISVKVINTLFTLFRFRRVFRRTACARLSLFHCFITLFFVAPRHDFKNNKFWLIACPVLHDKRSIRRSQP